MTSTAQNAGPNEAYERFKWTQTSAGLWERAIDECEGFYAYFCRDPTDPGKAGFPVTGCASFELQQDGEDDIGARIKDAFNRAWASLGLECPALGSWIEFDNDSEAWRKVCKPLDSAGVRDEWATSTFHLVHSSTSEEWFNSHPPTYRTPHLFLLQHTNIDEEATGAGQIWRATVALRSPHDTVDGVGVVQLLSRLLELAAGHFLHDAEDRPAGCHPKNLDQLLPLPMRVATGISPVPNARTKERWQAIQAANMASATAKPRLGLAITGNGDLPGSFQGASTVISKTAAASLTAKCKELGITVTHALSAAIVIALRDLHQSSTKKDTGDATSIMRYTNNILVNLRQAMQSNSLAHSVGNYHMIAAQSMAVDVPLATTPIAAAERFVSVALQFRDYYQSVRPSAASPNSRGLLEYAPMTWEAYTPKASPSAAASGASSIPAIADIAVSSLGNLSSLVKAEHGPLKVSRIWVAGVGLGAGVPMFLGGWDGEIEIGCVFDKAFHTTSSIVEFLDKTVSSLANAMASA